MIGPLGTRRGTPAAPVLRAGPVTTLVDVDRRRRGGLDHWVDGTMGILRGPAGDVVLAPDGPRTVRTGLAELEDPAADLEGRAVALGSPLAHYDHASGGPVHVDEVSGCVLLAYHGERFAHQDPADYWSFIGLAASFDGGRSFEDLGVVLESQWGETDPARPRPVDVGPGPLVERGGWLHLFFVDRSITARTVNLGVARARTSEVVAAAAAGRAPSFRKFHRGWFASPGRGGPATDLLEGERPFVLWLDVAFAPARDEFVLVHSGVLGLVDGRPRWNHLVRTSVDGLRWSAPTPVHPTDLPDEALYVTIDGRGPLQRRLDGPAFDLYYVRSSSAWRWDDARVERVEVVLDEAPEAAPPGSTR